MSAAAILAAAEAGPLRNALRRGGRARWALAALLAFDTLSIWLLSTLLTHRIEGWQAAGDGRLAAHLWGAVGYSCMGTAALTLLNFLHDGFEALPFKRAGVLVEDDSEGSFLEQEVAAIPHQPNSS